MPRPMWSGAISFGLVNIPVKLYKATASTSGKAISFHQIHKTCGSRIKQLRWCPKEDVEVPWDEVVKGYEFEKGKYVEVQKEELDALLPDEDYASVSIENFVALADVDPIYFDRAYYISPDGSPKAYALLHEALASTGKVAVARVLLRTRSHLALVRVLEDHLVMETMYYDKEVADPAEVPGIPKGKAAHVDKKQVEVAHQLIESMTIAWDPERYKDEYTQKVKKVIEAKIEGGEVVESPVPRAEEGGGQVVDLLDALKRSVDATKQRGKNHPATLADVAGLQQQQQQPVARSKARRVKTATRRRGGAKRRSRARHG
ncbi:MAG: Ku protein [Myxococcales bacterium]|nr:Ku protein [Myxococcales bacterium]